VGYSDLVAELERNLRLLDEVVRFQTVLLTEDIDPASVSVDPEEVQYLHVEEEEATVDAELERARSLGMAPRAPRGVPSDARQPVSAGDAPAAAQAAPAGAAEAPAVEAPAVEAPAVEAPVAEAAAVEAPAVEAPAAEAAAEEAPGAEKPAEESNEAATEDDKREEG